MFKKLWYRIFGVPTTGSVLADFKKKVKELENVAKVHEEISVKHTGIIMDAAQVRDSANREVERAEQTVAKFTNLLN